MRILKPYLEDKSLKKIGQNIKFDYIIFWKRDIDIQSMEDTMLMSYVLDAGKNRHNMDTLSEIHLGHKTISFKEIVGTGKKEINFSDVDIDKAKDYAAEDADITLRLFNHLNKMLADQPKLLNLLKDIEYPMLNSLIRVERNGAKIDAKMLSEYSDVLSIKIEELSKTAYEVAGEEFNMDSPKQLVEIL